LKRWIAILVTAMLAILQTGAFAECDDEISNYTRYADYIPQAAEPVGLSPERITEHWSSGSHGSGIPCLIRMWM